MFEQMLIVIFQVFTLFLIIGIGFVLGKRKIIDSQGSDCITWLIINVALPCAVFNSLDIELTAERLAELSGTFLAVAGVSLSLALISRLLFLNHSREKQSVLQMGAVYGNSAFMGIALVQAVLGEGALIYVTLVVVVETILLLCHAPMVMSGGKVDYKRIICSPGIVAFFAGIIRLLANISVPAPVGNAIEILSGMLTPLAMIIIGVQMSQAPIMHAFANPTTYVCAAIKLLVLPFLFSTTMTLAGLTPLAVAVITICKATPQAATLGVFAQKYEQDSKLAAQLIALSSIVQILTLPVVVALCQRFIL